MAIKITRFPFQVKNCAHFNWDRRSDSCLGCGVSAEALLHMNKGGGLIDLNIGNNLPTRIISPTLIKCGGKS